MTVRLIDEIRADHEKIEIRGELICAECESSWPCAAARGAAEIARLQSYQDETAKAWTKLTESQEQEIERLRAVLKEIAEMPPGSQGAYGKFARAQQIAKRTLEQKASGEVK